MNIKEKIGQRIKDERTKKRLTRKALAELTDDLNISRINNYERGERTPGPQEIKQLAKALEVSPAFLMCLSDDREGPLTQAPGIVALIPVLDYKQACSPDSYLEEIKNEKYSKKIDFIPVGSSTREMISEKAFALRVKDESMIPEFRLNDVLVIEPNLPPNPGDFVAAKISINDEVIIRKYKQLNSPQDDLDFELIALNADWPLIRINKGEQGKIIGTIVNLNRSLTKKHS
ncbi:TPA: helix-turn-helix domain-containing protein [Legionella pneumophila]|nr:helix-turn-helix domain-containing protein [Legionella pneumophila]